MNVDELDLVLAIGADTPPVDEEMRDRMRARLDAVIVGDPSARVRPPALRGPRRRRRWPVVASAAAVLALFAIVVQALWPIGPGGPTAAEALDELADVAAVRPPSLLAPGEYVYERSASSDVHEDENVSTGRRWRVVVSTEREFWVAADGSGRIVAVSGEPEFLTPADEVAWEAEGSPPLFRGGPVRDETYARGELPFVDLEDLPADPERLRDMIVAREILPGPAGHAENLRIVGDLLRETIGPPEVRAALFRATALLPEVESVGQVPDHAGRPGVAVSAEDDDASATLIFDPETSELLETRDEVAGVQIWTTVLESGKTEGSGRRP